LATASRLLRTITVNRPIAIFYHSLFVLGDPPQVLQSAMHVVHDQMAQLKQSGLEDAASEIYVGVNGGKESEDFASAWLPQKAKITYHGLQSRSENLTLVMMENWVKTHPNWAVLYFHAKGSSHAEGSDYGSFVGKWRARMMHHCVTEWRQCVHDLDACEAVGCHWLTGQGWDHSQHYFAGTFFWVRSEFWATIPSIFTRQRIKDSGIDSLESRYEAEVIIGNGPRLPCIKNYYDGPMGT
jgi:hypothetical protein